MIPAEKRWAFIDWDLAAPGRRLWDVALAACSFVPLYPDAARQTERFTLFCDAYGLSAAERAEVLRVTAQPVGKMWRILVDNAERDPYATVVRTGHPEFWKRIEQHVIDWPSPAWR